MNAVAVLYEWACRTIACSGFTALIDSRLVPHRFQLFRRRTGPHLLAPRFLPELLRSLVVQEEIGT